MIEEKPPDCARCGVPIFISAIAYKGSREYPNYYHHGCYNMEIRDEAIKQSGDTARSQSRQVQEW